MHYTASYSCINQIVAWWTFYRNSAFPHARWKTRDEWKDKLDDVNEFGWTVQQTWCWFLWKYEHCKPQAHSSNQPLKIIPLWRKWAIPLKNKIKGSAFHERKWEKPPPQKIVKVTLREKKTSIVFLVSEPQLLQKSQHNMYKAFLGLS